MLMNWSGGGKIILPELPTFPTSWSFVFPFLPEHSTKTFCCLPKHRNRSPSTLRNMTGFFWHFVQWGYSSCHVCLFVWIACSQCSILGSNQHKVGWGGQVGEWVVGCGIDLQSRTAQVRTSFCVQRGISISRQWNSSEGNPLLKVVFQVWSLAWQTHWNTLQKWGREFLKFPTLHLFHWRHKSVRNVALPARVHVRLFQYQVEKQQQQQQTNKQTNKQKQQKDG